MLVRMPVNPIDPALYHALTDAIRSTPHFYYVYLRRAWTFAHWGLDDLAIGDAYKVLLLTDVVSNPDDEYFEPAHAAETEYPPPNRAGFPAFKHTSLPTWILHLPDPTITWTSLEGARILAYRLLVYLLGNIGCLRSAWDFLRQLAGPHRSSRGTEHGLVHDDPLRLHLLQQIRGALNLNGVAEEDLNVVPDALPDRGFVQRLLYPWNAFEPQRYSATNLDALNAGLARVAPKLRAEVTELPILSEAGEAATYEKQLGLVATEDIAPGEEMLNETSFLTANSRLYDPLCDACSGELPSAAIGSATFACEECDDTVFCSEECRQGAMDTYHPAVCGSDADTTAKEPESGEAADALYFLLVGRALAFAQHQKIHPLDLRDTKFLWGEFTTPLVVGEDAGVSGGDEKRDEAKRDVDVDVDSESVFARTPTLPFSFKYNILYPMNYLEKMDVDIYAENERYDFWVLETLVAKFRGVASGKMSDKGVPEVSAVHALWCLANHSCAPNVKWEWSGSMRFWARTSDELVRWGEQSQLASTSASVKDGGVKKGDAILSHYCELGLPVHERREWAHGALGGDCRCPRCLWEAAKAEAT